MKNVPDSATFSWAKRMITMVLILGFMVIGISSSNAQDAGSVNQDASSESVFFIADKDQKTDGKTDGATPIITAVSPNSGKQIGGELVMIMGDNFSKQAKMFFDIVPAKIIVVNKEVIVAQTPAHEAGWAVVTVINPNKKADTIEQGYNYLPLPDADTVAPVVTINSLADDIEAPYEDGDNDGMTDLVLQVLDEGSGEDRCRYSPIAASYDEMNGQCTSPNGSIVSCPLGNLSRTTYSYFFACKDIAGNKSSSQQIDFTIAWLDAITGFMATDGEYTDKVVLTWNTDPVATGYKVWNGTEWMDVGNVTRYEDMQAPAAVINTGTVSASDGTSILAIELTSNGASPQQGVQRLYKVKGYTADGDGLEGTGDLGYRGVGELQLQWQISEDDTDQKYSDISGAIGAAFTYSGDPADGIGRYYRLRLNAAGAEEVFSAGDRGFRKPYDRTIIEDITQEVIIEEITKGNIITENIAPDETETATFFADYTFTAPTASVVVPPETTISRTGGGLMNLLNFQLEDITREVQAERETKTFAGIRLGYEDHGLTFSQPITITFSIGEDQDGKLVDILYRSAGDSAWHHETYCTVEQGLCIFQVTHATDYAAGPGPLVVRETAEVQLGLEAIISLACTDGVVMGTITGYGKSNLASNAATCNIRTNNNSGYKLEWQASPTVMSTGSPNNDTFAAYIPSTPDTPEPWSVTDGNSAWGARLSDTSTTENTSMWGTDDQSGIAYGTTARWLNVRSSSPFQIVSRTTETDNEGDDEVIVFGAEVGASRIQPTGMYSVNVTMTATTL